MVPVVMGQKHAAVHLLTPYPARAACTLSLVALSGPASIRQLRPLIMTSAASPLPTSINTMRAVLRFTWRAGAPHQQR